MNSNRISLIFLTLLVLSCLLASGCSNSNVESDDTAAKVNFDQTVSDALDKAEVTEHQNHIEYLIDSADRLRRGVYDDRSWVIRRVAESLQRGVAEGLVTWEELGFTTPDSLAQATADLIATEKVRLLVHALLSNNGCDIPEDENVDLFLQATEEALHEINKAKLIAEGTRTRLILQDEARGLLQNIAPADSVSKDDK